MWAGRVTFNQTKRMQGRDNGRERLGGLNPAWPSTGLECTSEVKARLRPDREYGHGPGKLNFD